MTGFQSLYPFKPKEPEKIEFELKEEELDSTAKEDKTPQEVWTGKKPSLSHMRVFGWMHMYTFERRNEPSWIVNLKVHLYWV